ncbi:MAG: hypothetical protein RIE56_11300, partial [Amphiplicatus sp.]
MTGEAREKTGDALKARVDALSPRRLVVLCAGFLLALSALIFLQLREDASARRVETELRVAQAASECASALNVAIMTGEPVRAAQAACHPGGRAAIFHLAPNGVIITAYGAGKAVDLDAATARALPLETRGERVLDLASGDAAASWRPLDNGEALLVAAPAGDMFSRTPLWISYALILAAIFLVTGSLLAAFIRQSRAAAEAAGAVVALRDFNAALVGGRCSPWRYDGKARTIQISRALLEPLGLGARDRVLTLREMSALLHPDDLRSALAIFTGDPSGLSEGAARLREPSGGWSRIYLRTAPDAMRFERRGVAFDLSGAKGATPASMIAEARLKDAI